MIMNNKWDELINDVKTWFHSRYLNHAVIGFSGGIDSSVTIALLRAAKINCTVVQISTENQKYSSDYDVTVFSDKFNCSYKKYVIDILLNSNEGKEAALPILRNAYLYGVCAELRKLTENAIVVGSANFDETAYLGFFGKASDAAQDFYPISHLHKSEVYELARYLGIPEEIINAVPSGDLQWSGDLNDYKMTGATYDQIKMISSMVEQYRNDSMLSYIEKLPNPNLFVDNVLRNRFKYEIPFGQKHISDRLEQFRQKYYSNVVEACEMYRFLIAHKN